MKKNIGSQLALYPTPVTIIGAINGEKPTWTLVAHVGIIGHDRVLISLASNHFINGIIKNTNKLSINIVDEKILPEADYSGSVSGIKVDKSNLFEYEIGDAGTPIINKSPLTMECTVIDIYNSPNFESFICTIDNTYVEEEHLNEKGKINYNTLKPVLFEFPTYEYLKTGNIIGKCLSFKKNPNE
ncbi:flavin reductase family protein [Intestinibacter bartlettii]|uniref:Flavin reductase family protein n=1 Tax=Intestinibacter bartlettii TaxID=261299 RepID=A0ABS6DWC6_9FIRM|nr:flavin reductase family protein [Intestinibacter bartlettii]MBU5335552.1 flavin reductase family protein [Intestinibacter bartlettii]